MKRIFLAVGVVLSMSLSACAVYTPAGSVVLDPDHSHHGDEGGFCPPGQVKKGRC